MEKNTEKGDSKVYEIGFLLISTIPEEKVGDEASRIKDLIEKAGGVLISEEAAKLRKLAYTMVKKIATANKRFDTAYFGWVKFEADADKIVALKKQVEEGENVLRVLLINTLRDTTLLSDKVNLSENDGERKPNVDKRPATAEELDKSIDKTVEELTVAA